MSYFNNVQIRAADSPSIDAFGRWRTSDVVTLFDSKQLYDTGSINWVTQIVGNGTASWVPQSVMVKMTVTGSNSSVIRQTRRRFNYQPGKSQLIVCTGNFGAHDHSSMIERIGYFDQSDGLFFELSGSTFRTGLRNSGVTTYTSQSAWNLDVFDGTGPSGNKLILSASQIYFMDFEWLGVGRARYGIYQGGIPYYVHQITNINALNESVNVYIDTPNLPVRYEIISSASVASGSLNHICSAVMSEGGVGNTGPVRSIDYPGFGTSSVPPLSQSLVMAIRLKTSSLSSTVRPNRLYIDTIGGLQHYKWAVLLNPITTSLSVWTDVQDSSVQWNTGSYSGSTLITSDGFKLASGYVDAVNKSVDFPLTFDQSVGLGSTVDGVADVLAVAVTNFTSGSAQNVPLSRSFRVSLGWQETV